MENNASIHHPSSVLIDEVADWLMAQALDEAPIEKVVDGCFRRLHATGIPLLRAHLAYRTLHPLFAAISLVWRRDGGLDVASIAHGGLDNQPGWRTSPLKYLIDNRMRTLRRHLVGDDALLDFPLLEEIREEGGSDYLAYVVPFGDSGVEPGMDDGIIGSWVSDREAGFTNSDVHALLRIQHRLAVACKVFIRSQITANIVHAYLGANAGERVLNGRIRRGDGEDIHAVIWFCDLRGSTALADSMPRREFLALLNQFLEHMAGAVMAHEGEVLRFIGDAALAIFPVGDDDGGEDACRRAVAAARDAGARLEEWNRASAGEGEPRLEFGVGLHLGDVMYGNIGSPERVEFTVIGAAANEAARIESLCKSLNASPLLSETFVEAYRGDVTSLGRHRLRGVGETAEIFTLPTKGTLLS